MHYHPHMVKSCIVTELLDDMNISLGSSVDDLCTTAALAAHRSKKLNIFCGPLGGCIIKNH